MKPSEKILAGRELIARKGGWCQHSLARGSDGEEINPPDYEGAVTWCIVGAIDACGGWDSAASGYIQKTVGMDTVWFNNTPGRTQLECVVALEKAALLAMSEGQ